MATVGTNFGLLGVVQPMALSVSPVAVPLMTLASPDDLIRGMDPLVLSALASNASPQVQAMAFANVGAFIAPKTGIEPALLAKEPDGVANALTYTPTNNFPPSPALTRSICDELARVVKPESPHRKKLLFSFHFVNRPDITPTEAPKSPNEPLNLDRARRAYRINLLRYFGSIAAVADVERMSAKLAVGEMPPACIATALGFDETVLRAIAGDFGFPKGADVTAWAMSLLAEIQQWLRELPEQTARRHWGKLVLTPDERILLHAEFRE